MNIELECGDHLTITFKDPDGAYHVVFDEKSTRVLWWDGTTNAAVTMHESKFCHSEKDSPDGGAYGKTL